MNYGNEQETAAPMSRRPLHILMTTDTVGGIWTYALELARGLAAQNALVTLATLGKAPTALQRREAYAIPGLELLHTDGKLEWMHDPWSDVDNQGRWLLKLEVELKPDIIHLNSYAHANLPFKAPVLIVAHQCVISWWRAVKGKEAPAVYDTYRTRVRAGLTRAHVVVAPSQAMANAITDCYEGACVAPRVIPNGRSLSALQPQGLSAYTGRKWPFVLSVGRLWDDAKNLIALESVASQLNWPVYVAGEEADLETGKKVPLLDPSVRRLGKLTPEHVMAFMRRAGIYALPARYEPFGLSVLEAALCGCMLVLSDIPSLRENWDGAALWADPNDPAALKKALCNAISDETLRKNMADAARQRADRFTAEAMATQYRHLYDEFERYSPPATGFSTNSKDFVAYQ